MVTREVPSHRPAEIFAARLRAVRESKGWNQRDLATAMGQLGWTMDRSAIAKIEGGKRNILLDEAFAFAAALGVSPSALMLPTQLDQLTPETVSVATFVEGARKPISLDGPTVELAPNLKLSRWATWQWFRGLEPLPNANAEQERFFYDQRPTVEATALRRVPWLAEQLDAAWHMVRLAGCSLDFAENINHVRGRATLSTALMKALELNNKTAHENLPPSAKRPPHRREG